MKLYLSSFRFGDHAKQLSNLYSNNKKVALIVNAWDAYPDGERRLLGIQRETEGLIQLGLQPEILDLRTFFDKPADLAKKITEFGGVWVTGGNTFALRRAFHYSGLDLWLQENRSDNNFVYGGYSAGVCVLSPELKGLELVDEPNVVPDGYKADVIWQGVGLIDFAFAPHFESDHPESDMVTQEVEYMVKNGINYKALHDGEVIILEI